MSDELRIPRDANERDRLAREAGLTADERAALERFCDEQERDQRLPCNPRDLLTDAERDELDRDLAEIAACRRRAVNASANWSMP